MRKGGTYLALGDSTVYTKVANNDGPSLYAGLLNNWINTNYSPIRYFNKGLSGTSSADWYPYLWKWGIGATDSPDLVTIGLGMNDGAQNMTASTFQTNMQNLINVLKKRNPNVIIIICTPNTVTSSNGYVTETQLNVLRPVADTLATNNTNVYACHFENAWTQANAGTYVNSDGIHPNVSGHQQLYNLLQPIIQTNAATWLNSLGQ